MAPGLHSGIKRNQLVSMNLGVLLGVLECSLGPVFTM